jgi:inosine-uridine nucleoside N-ribohydrolase
VKKILFDTDIGSDIDDAVCLAYLLAHPECDLLGITTVSGEPVKRARMASAMCIAGGREIPIYPGAAEPLLIEQPQKTASQAAALGNWKHEYEFPEDQAISFLRDTIRANPGEVTLLAVGPLTNIGLLFATHPEIPELLDALVLMAGVFLSNDPVQKHMEWNVKCDPHAAVVVYEEAVRVHRSIGLDVTRHVTMPADEVRRRFEAPLLKPVLDFAEVWFQQRQQITFHDPLAAATIFNEDLCTYQVGTVSVVVGDEARLGVTDWTRNPDEPKHEIADTVNAAAFFSEYFSVMKT